MISFSVEFKDQIMNEYFVEDGIYYNTSDQKLFSGEVRDLDFEIGNVIKGKRVGSWINYAPFSYKEGNYRLSECSFEDGKKDGCFITYYENTQIRYKCFYKKGNLDGPYKSFHINGKLFEEGNYKNNKKIGSWVTNFNDGEDELRSYQKDGLFAIQDILDGYGQIIYGDGEEYNGEFKDKKFCGKGTYNFASGLIYEGEFVNNKFNGKGVLTFPNKKIYNGEFKDNKFNGIGAIQNEDGSKYEGEFKDHQYNGKGKFTEPSGKIEIGIWKGGVKIN